ncbi:hypothetical protein QN219_27265 [Sinorhizobium sp. 7-81]|uniref:N,N-dimethylformamidase beta subunit family domain-containing protein n=1 Tax=Sinorhizobium sp. 8-89 TaxID=3049089 RepID=UPI0024C41B0A|nr:N,N-dimethylformamidase beta subunit family domain-containing protein [Sinorhizobium sp. 8-89]MDK1493695.1 hypothetical protein [Sinorhizobium sp. 8-89]
MISEDIDEGRELPHEPLEHWGGFIPRPQGFDATRSRSYETVIDDARVAQVFCYTNLLSYRPGDDVLIHASTTATEISIEIRRDEIGSNPVDVIQQVKAPFSLLPADFAANGCGWPVVARWTVPRDLRSGFYLVIARAADGQGNVREHVHGITVLPAKRGARAPVLFILATSTWTAYNDFGGSCHYLADNEPEGLPFAPKLSIHRPWARGFMSLPAGAPRKGYGTALEVGAIPRYPASEFATLRGYSRYYANAGWANYDRHFAFWAEQNGYNLDYATQTDLHNDPDILEAYRCAVIVGHDEYWTWEMREAVDQYVEKGGRVARFGGNFYWQIRLEDGGTKQICYKKLAKTHDPLMGSTHARRITAEWEDPLVGRPGAATFGLNATWGMYANHGAFAPRGSGGFTIYRPEHWAFTGGNFYYGDILGGSARIFGYEVDGLEYEIRDGLPYPTFKDGAPENLEILAMGLANNREVPHYSTGESLYYSDETDTFTVPRYGADTPENRDKASRGSGMIVHFTRGKGEVFNAGAADWVAGLAARELGTEIVTRNVLDRFSR